MSDEAPLRMDGAAKWKVPVVSERAKNRMPVLIVRDTPGARQALGLDARRKDD